MTCMGTIGCGMTMMGQPTLVGAGTDCNNYLDVRNELHVTNQATVRIDQMFASGDSVLPATQLGAENGFMPSSGPRHAEFRIRCLTTISRSREASPGTTSSILAW